MTDRHRPDRNSRYAYSEARVATVPDIPGSLWRAVVDYSPRRYPKMTGLLLLWLFGLFAVFLSPAPVKISPEKLARYDQLVLQVRLDTAQPAVRLCNKANAQHDMLSTGARRPTDSSCS